MNKLFYILLLYPFVLTAKNINCNEVRQGIWKTHALFGGLNTVIRTTEKQIETYGRTGLVLEYDIQWTGDCSFMLLNQKILKGQDSSLAINHSDTIYNEIVEVNNYWNKMVMTVNGCDPKIEVSYFPIDTTAMYKELDNFTEFTDYNGASAATFVGYNYAVVFKQNSIDSTKYMIAFFEALQIRDKARFRILDNLICTIDTSQRITITGCRYDDIYDKEVLAIYTPTKPNKESFIVKAWRCNKTRMKIEEIPVTRVKYKEEDKFAPIWEK
jgi:hypothetical protein